MRKMKCTKDCVSQLGVHEFTKGKIYETDSYHVTEKTMTTNDLGEPHYLGNWAKHFKILN